MTPLHYILAIAVFVLPLILVVIAIVSATWKWKKKRPKSAYSWEGAVLVISITASLIGGLLAHDSLTRTSELGEMETRITEAIRPPSIQLSENQRPYEVINDISRNITTAYERDAGIRHVIRALFHPGALVGDKLEDDIVLGDRFRSLGFPCTYIIGYPTAAEASEDETLRSRRKQMQRYLFALLSSPRWQDELFSGVKGEFAVYYVPFSRSFDSWEVATTRTIGGGQVFFSGNWVGDSDRPVPTTVLQISAGAVTQSMYDDHAAMRTRGMRFIRQQLQLAIDEREPCMIFSSEDEDGGLRPLSIAELEERVGIIRFHDPHSPVLRELDELLRHVKNVHAE